MASYETMIEYLLGKYIERYNPITEPYDHRKIKWRFNPLERQWELWEEHKRPHKYRMLRRVTDIELASRGISLPEPPLPIAQKKQEKQQTKRGHKRGRLKKLCPHENKIETTRFGADEPEWICNDCGASHTAPSMKQRDAEPPDPTAPPKDPKSLEAWLKREQKRSEELEAWITAEEKRVAERRARNAKRDRKPNKKLKKIEETVEKVLFGGK